MRKRWPKLLSWALALLLGALFILAGSGKFLDFANNARRFASWGYASWFVIVIGSLETLGGVLVLVPRLAAYGAIVIAVVMVGAAYTHASTGIGSPTGALIIIGLAGTLARLRWADRRRTRGSESADG